MPAANFLEEAINIEADGSPEASRRLDAPTSTIFLFDQQNLDRLVINQYLIGDKIASDFEGVCIRDVDLEAVMRLGFDSERLDGKCDFCRFTPRDTDFSMVRCKRVIILLMRILIISDIHANLVALETVLAATAGQFDALWCLGDVVGYGPRPNECVDLIRERAQLCVIGNHDWAALDRPGINVEDFNPHARHAILWTQAQLSASSRQYLNQLADQPVHPLQDLSLLLTHASPREPVWEYILTPSVALENFAVFQEEICLVGHTHKPALYTWRIHDELATEDGEAGTVVIVSYLQPQPGMTLRLDASERLRIIINPGSVGQPRDNDTRAAYAILDLEKMTWRYERIAYPVELTQNQMRAARLPRRLIDRLSFGW